MTVFEKNSIIASSMPTDRPMYAMYLRKSRADLELEAISKEETLARHKAMLYALAERHNIAPSQIVVYHEIVSGDSLDERPQAQKLLEDVHERKYKGVLVVEIERLARGSTKDQGEVSDAFTFSDTLIITPAKVYDPNDEFDQEYFEFGLFMSRREYKTIRRRNIAGKEQAVKEGNYLLPFAPYGFDIVRKSKHNRYLIEKPAESQYVKMIFDWFTEERKTQYWIAQQLTKMGVLTPKKNKEWNKSTVKAIMLNEHYIGKVTWGVNQMVKRKNPITGKVEKRQVATGKKQIYEGKHDGFITEEQFEKVKSILGTSAPVKASTELANPLAGLLVCKHCGKSIMWKNPVGTAKERLIHPFGVHACKMKSVIAQTVFDALTDSLKASIEDFQIELDSGNENAEAERRQTMIAAMEKELAKQEQMKNRLFDSWEAQDGTYTKEEFLERKQMYVQNISRLKAEIEETKKNVPAPVDYAERISTLHAAIDCINDPSINATAKNNFLKQVIDKIEYDVIDLGRRYGGKVLLDVYLK